MIFKCATLQFIGDEGYPQYTNIEAIEAVSEKQAIYLYEKKHRISFKEAFIQGGRMGTIYKPESDYFR